MFTNYRIFLPSRGARLGFIDVDPRYTAPGFTHQRVKRTKINIKLKNSFLPPGRGIQDIKVNTQYIKKVKSMAAQ